MSIADAFKSLFESASDAVYILDMRGNLWLRKNRIKA